MPGLRFRRERDLSQRRDPKTHRVNLELPLRVGDPLGGHLVQGHVDAIGKVTLVEDDRVGGRRLWIRPPRRFMADVVAKGSVAVDGVSLTVAEMLGDRFSVALIPETLRRTNLGDARIGDRVNLEFDMIAKVVRTLVAPYLAGNAPA